VKLTIHLYLEPKLIMHDTIPPLPHMPSWQVQRQLHVYFTLSLELNI